MGMNLVSKNGEEYRANFSSWSYIRAVLELLGCDIAEMSFYNDGDVVQPETALAWAEAIELGIRALGIVRYADKAWEDGFFEHPCLLSDQTTVSRSQLDPLRKSLGVAFSEEGQKGPMDQRTREWLLDFARFCRESGGFEQY